jgi:hypothetical protein
MLATNATCSGRRVGDCVVTFLGEAEAIREGFGEVFPPLTPLLEPSPTGERSILAKAAGEGRYDVVLQLARRLEVRPVRDLPRPRAEDDLAVAVRLAADAGEWAVVN